MTAVQPDGDHLSAAVPPEGDHLSDAAQLADRLAALTPVLGQLLTCMTHVLDTNVATLGTLSQMVLSAQRTNAATHVAVVQLTERLAQHDELLATVLAAIEPP